MHILYIDCVHSTWTYCTQYLHILNFSHYSKHPTPQCKHFYCIRDRGAIGILLHLSAWQLSLVPAVCTLYQQYRLCTLHFLCVPSPTNQCTFVHCEQCMYNALHNANTFTAFQTETQQQFNLYFPDPRPPLHLLAASFLASHYDLPQPTWTQLCKSAWPVLNMVLDRILYGCLFCLFGCFKTNSILSLGLAPVEVCLYQQPRRHFKLKTHLIYLNISTFLKFTTL